MRSDGRSYDELREVKITRNYTSNPAGSVLIEFGKTKVLCTASLVPKLPKWRMGSGLGWLTAEYAMLPAATNERNYREAVKGKLSGRTQEISRLIGRSMRAAIDLSLLGENTIALDCDVLEADGGTRTAAITGSYVALADAVNLLQQERRLPTQQNPLLSNVAAVSVGIISNEICLDLAYEEDSRAGVDLNIVMTREGEFIEIQGTGETITFNEQQLTDMIAYAKKGITDLIKLQDLALSRKH